METTGAKSVRPLSSTDGEVVSEIAEGREESAQVGHDEGASREIEIDEEELEATAQHPRIPRKPVTPTKAMVLEHELHHAEYRDWCKHCVAGKGVCHLHRSTEKDHSSPEFSVDYAFMTLKGEIEHGFKLSEEGKVGASPVLVGYDHRSRGIWAMAVEQKGVTESSVAWIDGKLNQAGCRGTKVILKSDQEESIVALKKAVAVRRRAETIPIESPVRDSRANGAIERTIRTWAAQVRTLRHHLEYRLNKKMSNGSPLMSWLTAWAADVLTRYRVQAYGKTSYEFTTGHKGAQPIAMFGEKVMFMHTPLKTSRDKMQTDWDTGYFLGINPGTTEYIIGNDDGVFSCATIRRLPDENAFDPAIIDDIKVRYHEYVMEGASSTPVMIRPASMSTSRPDPEALPRVPRRTT